MKGYEIINEEKKDNNLSKTIILGLIGLVLLLIPDEFHKFVGIIVGIGFLIMGINSFYKYYKLKSNMDLFIGILTSVLGITVMIYPYSLLNFAAICLGVYLIVISLSKFILAFSIKNISKNWLGTLIIAIIILALGLMLIFNPFSGIAITKLCGLYLLIVSIFDIIDTYILTK